MKYPLVLFLAVLLALGFALPAAAEKADRDQPMNAEADALRYDDLKQTSVFTGNVVITKGSTVIRGERVEVRQDPDGFQTANVVAAPGKLAFYRRKRDSVDEYIEGEAERIEYDGRADTVKLLRRAVLRRLVGATVADETAGARISYDNTTDVFSVDGGADNRSSGNPSGRVRAVISSKAARAPGASGPGPALRPSPTLGTEAK